MCAEIDIDGDLIENIGQLRAKIAPEHIVFRAGVTLRATGDEFCLCPVDIEATAHAAGMTVDHEADDAFAVHFVRKST